MEIDSITDFQLSVAIQGFQCPLRSVCANGNDQFAVAEVRGLMTVFKRDNDQDRNFSLLYKSQRDHRDLAICLEHISGQWVSGGADNCIQVWDEKETSLTLAGAENCVNSISQTSDGRLISGSWDGVVRIWTEGFAEEIKGHHDHAVEVLGLPNNLIITGSANGKIVIYEHSDMKRVIVAAHSHAVRKIIAHPLGFASAGNDGVVKVWTLSGDLVMEIHINSSGETKFLHDLCHIPETGEMVVSGEDGNVRILSAEGKIVQAIAHPGSVRGVCVLPNGDFVTACHDRVVRVFTRTTSRTAPEDELSSFTQLSAMASMSGMTAMDTSSLPGPTALHKAGAKDGAIKVINQPGRGAIVYQWVAADNTWTELGEAVGQSKKQSIDGKTYDFVTDVQITPEVSRKLGFNKDDDAEQVAADFCNINGLPPDYRDQIIAHVAPMIDSSARAARLERERLAQQSALKHIPAWNSGGFELYSAGKYPQMLNAILKRNQTIDPASALSPAEVKTFQEVLMPNLSNTGAYQVAPFTNVEAKLMCKLLSWPGALALPALDIYRVFMCHSAACLAMSPFAESGAASSVFPLLVNHLADGKNQRTLILKSMSNWIARRKKTPQERSGAVPPPLEEFLLHLFQNVLGPNAEYGTALYGDKASALALVMLSYNLVLWLGRCRISQSRLFPCVVQVLLTLIPLHATEAKILFYALLTIGSAASVCPLVEPEPLRKSLDTILQSAPLLRNAALTEVCSDLVTLLR
jgi:WD40 repeat protein